LLRLVGSSILLYLIDDARSNKNQVHTTLFKLLCSLSSAHFTSPKHRVLSQVVSVSQNTRYMDHCAASTLFMPCSLCANDQNSILSYVGVGVLCTVVAATVAAHSMPACDSSGLWNCGAACCYTHICHKHNVSSSAGCKFHCDSSQYCSHCSLLLLMQRLVGISCRGRLKNVTKCSWVNQQSTCRRQVSKLSGKFSKCFVVTKIWYFSRLCKFFAYFVKNMWNCVTLWTVGSTGYVTAVHYVLHCVNVWVCTLAWMVKDSPEKHNGKYMYHLFRH